MTKAKQTTRSPKRVCIYALVDPLTLLVRYVGKSNNPQSRLRTHLSRRALATDNSRTAWIKSLLSRGLKPILVILQTVPFAHWAEAERAWIVQFRMIGAPLTNTSDGGEGVLEPTPETFAKQRRPANKRYPKKKKRLSLKKKIKP